MRRSEADRWVDLLHEEATHREDPVAFLRGRQAEVEARYAALGRRDDLHRLQALERSIGAPA